MTTQSTTESWNEELWHLLFATGHPDLIAKQKRFIQSGTPPRCRLCLAPFGQMPPKGWSDDTPGPSNRNPRYCSLCDGFIRANPGGARVKMTMVFTDVRNSTHLSEQLPLKEYVRLINDFYRRTTGVFVQTDGFMMDVIGDEVFALYPTGFSGVSEGDDEVDAAPLGQVREAVAAGKAIEAARRLSKVSAQAPPQALPFGTSVHTGEVFIGTVRGAEEGIFDVRVWGPEVNKAARLCSVAKAGEALISDEAATAGGLDTDSLHTRQVDLKGLSQGAKVWVVR